MTHVINAIAEICKDAILAAGMTGQVVRGRLPPAKPDQCPLTLVYARKDVATATGSARVGVPEFFHTTTVTFVTYDVGNDGAEIEDKLGAHADKISAAILLAPGVIGQFEGCAAMRTDFDFPEDATAENVGRLILELDLLHGTRWDPVDQFSDTLTSVRVNEGEYAPQGEFNPPQD